VAAHATVALMLVSISASFSPRPIEAIHATAPEIQRQERVSRYRAARLHYATQDEDMANATFAASSDDVMAAGSVRR
jgi:hypothetical protein